MRRSLLSIVLLALALASGCSRTGVLQPPSAMADLPREDVVPAAEGLVFHYEGVNGYAGAWWAVAVYADGVVLATTDTGLRSGRIAMDQVHFLAGSAAKAIRGVGDARDCKATDLSDETFRLRTKTEELVAMVYGLGCDSTAPLKQLARFKEALSSIRGKATDTYTPSSVLVWVGKTGGPEPSPLPPKWPLPEHPPSVFPAGAHLQLSGEVVSVLPVQNGGTNRAVYEYEGTAYWLQWRPVLPGVVVQ